MITALIHQADCRAHEFHDNEMCDCEPTPARNLRSRRPMPHRLEPNTTYAVHDVYIHHSLERGTLTDTTDEDGFLLRYDGTIDIALTNWFAGHPNLTVVQ